MKQVTLGKALKLANALEDQIHALRRQRNQVSTYSYNLGEEPEKPTVTVDEIIVEINKLSGQVRALRMAVAAGNLTAMTDFEFGGKALTQGEAILLLNQTLKGVSEIKSLADKQPKTRSTPYGGGVAEFTEITYDLEKMKIYHKDLERLIRDLREATDKVNITFMVEIPDEIEV